MIYSSGMTEHWKKDDPQLIDGYWCFLSAQKTSLVDLIVDGLRE